MINILASFKMTKEEGDKVLTAECMSIEDRERVLCEGDKIPDDRLTEEGPVYKYLYFVRRASWRPPQVCLKIIHQQKQS
jgi:hypothetical protein